MFLSCLSTKTLYSLLPALLDSNPFSTDEKEKEKDGARGAEGDENKKEDGAVDDVSILPPKVAGLVEVYRCSLMLSREACLSPPLTSQTFGYLFFFTNTSLLNTLLERGEKALDELFVRFTATDNISIMLCGVFFSLWHGPSLFSRWFVFMVQSRPDPDKPGLGSGLAPGGWVRRHCLGVYEETLHYSQLSVYSQDTTHSGTAVFLSVCKLKFLLSVHTSSSVLVYSGPSFE